MSVHDSDGLKSYSATTYDFTIDIPTDSDRILALHFIVYGSGISVNGVALDPSGNDESLTQLESNTGNSAGDGYTYYLVNPSSGNGQTLRVTLSSSTNHFAGIAVSMSGMDTTSITDGYSSTSGNNNDPQDSATSSNAGGHVTGAFFSESNTSPGVDTWTGCTGQNTVLTAAGFGNCAGGAYATQTSSGSVTADFSTGQSQAWVVMMAIWPVASSNAAPTITPNTADNTDFSTPQPKLKFAGSDTDNDDLRYQLQISDSEDFASGATLGDSYTPASPTGIIHPNPEASASTWAGEIQVDDRPGQSFVGNGGILHHIDVEFGGDTDADGYALIRVYKHTGTFGTSSEPLNPADPADTPTLSWLAESAQVYVDSDTADGWQTFNFTGANAIRLEDGQHYVFIVDWLPNDRVYDNTITIQADTGLGHSGNCYIDGYASANNGVYSSADLVFRVYETFVLLDKVSGTDAGFANEDTPADTDPFDAGDQVSFTVQSGDALEVATYHWHVRVKDPSGSDTWSDWSTTRSFSVVADAVTPLVGQLNKRKVQKLLVR